MRASFTTSDKLMSILTLHLDKKRLEPRCLIAWRTLILDKMPHLRTKKDTITKTTCDFPTNCEQIAVRGCEKCARPTKLLNICVLAAHPSGTMTCAQPRTNYRSHKRENHFEPTLASQTKPLDKKIRPPEPRISLNISTP